MPELPTDEWSELEALLSARTRLDENFDQLRGILKGNGVTLGMALKKLREMRERGELNYDVAQSATPPGT